MVGETTSTKTKNQITIINGHSNQTTTHAHHITQITTALASIS
jgi:hypothetical protein